MDLAMVFLAENSQDCPCYFFNICLLGKSVIAISGKGCGFVGLAFLFKHKLFRLDLLLHFTQVTFYQSVCFRHSFHHKSYLSHMIGLVFHHMIPGPMIIHVSSFDFRIQPLIIFGF